MKDRNVASLTVALALVMASGLTACGSEGDSDSAQTSSSTATSTTTGTITRPTSATMPNKVLPTAADAARFLDQATFGATASDVYVLQTIGFDQYLSRQLAAPVTQYSGFSYMPNMPAANCQVHPATPTDASSLCARDQYSMFQLQRQFFTHAMNNPDQLRQRIAFALSQIFVIASDTVYEAYGMADYQNMLLRDALGNYRQLLEDVTLNPGMGAYLNMAYNDKSNAALGTAPNENYGREVLQLFSIGLYQLNPDGSQQLDSAGAPIPTCRLPTC